MLHARHVLSGWFVAFVLAIALIVPIQGRMPTEAMPHEQNSPISLSFVAPISFAASAQDVAELPDHALLCHMHFEHHQLIRSENAYVIPTFDSIGACYLTRVIPLASREPYPLQRPPRA
jgi:hypothetical protein